MEPCKFEKIIIEMAGDVKVLASEFKAMNGSLRDTKKGYDNHEIESKVYRHQVSILWAALHTIKWAIGLLVGTGVLWKIVEFIAR
jgi:hypothetical protein